MQQIISMTSNVKLVLLQFLSWHQWLLSSLYIILALFFINDHKNHNSIRWHAKNLPMAWCAGFIQNKVMYIHVFFFCLCQFYVDYNNETCQFKSLCLIYNFIQFIQYYHDIHASCFVSGLLCAIYFSNTLKQNVSYLPRVTIPAI